MSESNGTTATAARLADRFKGRGRHITYRNGWTEKKTDATVRDVLAHLEGRATVGAFPGPPGAAHFGVIDVDAHFKDSRDEPRDPTPAEVAANERYAIAKSAELDLLGVRHLLFRHDDRGSYHIHIPTELIDPARLGRWLDAQRADAGGLSVDIFPHRTGTQFGVRLPGRHHKRPECWTEVYTASGEWAPWPAARDALADLEPNPTDKFPDPGEPEPPKTKVEPKATRPDAGALPEERPGEHYDRVTDVRDVIRELGFVYHSEGKDGRTRYTRPGKKKAEGCSVSVRGNSVYVFTSSIPGLKRSAENGKKPYTPFGLMVALKHNGNASAAASELARLGYGCRRRCPTITFDGVTLGGDEPTGGRSDDRGREGSPEQTSADAPEGASDADASSGADATPGPEGGEKAAPDGAKKADAKEEKKGRPAAADRMVELAHAAGVRLFHTPDHEAFAQVPVNAHTEVYPVKGTQFRRWLAREFFQAEGRAANGEAMQTALGTLEGIAAFACKEHPVHLRVAAAPDGGIVLDLCDDDWRAVVIRPGRWEVVPAPPVLFRRSQQMRALPEPTRGGDLSHLKAYLNLKTEEDWLLLVAWLAAAVRPRGPYPVNHLKGEAGTAKTTTGRLLRRLFDPGAVDLKSQPREERDLAVASKHGWAIAYDNLSSIPIWLSDCLCRMATGGGFGTRTLYSNDEETVFDFIRPVLITSIEDVVGQPDLLDRTLGVELAQIPDDKRRSESELWAAFDRDHAAILGGLLDVVARALELLPEVEAEKNPLPRLADFALFGEAVARALGHPSKHFLNVLKATRAGADQTVLEGSPLALTLFNFVRDRKEFRGTYTTLLKAVNDTADEADKKRRGWPTNAQALSGQVRKIAPALRRLGLEHDESRDARTRIKTVTLKFNAETSRETSSASSASSAPDGNGKPGNRMGANDAPGRGSSAHRSQATPAGASDPASDGHDPPSSAPNSKPGNRFGSGASDASGASDGSHPFSGRNGTAHPVTGDVETEEEL